jgi:hypothetical protein
MLSFGNRNKLIMKPELANYIKESLNKSLNNTLNKFKEGYSNKKIYNPSDDSYSNNIYILLPFVSFLSFLAGYNFKRLQF